MSVSHFRHRDKIVLSIATTNGDGSATIHQDATVTRSIFDGPDAATYGWLVRDPAGKPIAGRSGQFGDKIIVEEYPVLPGSTLEIVDSDTEGSWEVILWTKP